MKKLSLYLISLLFFANSSCKKEENDTTQVPKTTFELLTADVWKLSGRIKAESINGDSNTDLFSYLANCKKDNIVIYSTSNSFTIDEGASKCDPQDPQIFYSGTWIFNSDESVITVTNEENNGVSKGIHELTLTKLTLYYPVVLYDGSTYWITEYYNH